MKATSQLLLPWNEKGGYNYKIDLTEKDMYLPNLNFTLAKVPVLLLFCAVLSGCGLLVTPVAKLKHTDSEPVIGEDQFIQDVALRFGFMAYLSDLVYYRPPENKDTASAPRPAEPCHDSVPLPKLDSGTWVRLPSSDDVKFCVNDRSGLFYETFAFEDDKGKFLEAVIVFRGTENDNGQFFKDWSANLSALFGLQPKQYNIALDYLPRVINELKRRNPDLRIYAAGHSLGGGLAQQAGYRFKEIKEVYTFNTSPVTNWSWMVFRKLVKNDYPAIYRLYHTGEILEKARFVTTSFNSSRYNRYDLGIQLWPKSSFKGHSINIMTCGFAGIIKDLDEDVQGAHFYPKSFAYTNVYQADMCKAFRKQKIAKDQALLEDNADAS